MQNNNVQKLHSLDSELNNSVKDYIYSKVKPLTPNIIHEIDSALTQKYLQSVDYSKYIVFK